MKLRVVVWNYKRLYEVPNGCMKLRTVAWSTKRLHGNPNVCMELQLVAWSYKRSHRTPTGCMKHQTLAWNSNPLHWNSKRLHRAINVPMQQYCNDEWYINWRDKSKKTVEKVSALQDANCLCETNKRGGNCTAHFCVYVCICIKMIVLIKKKA